MHEDDEKRFLVTVIKVSLEQKLHYICSRVIFLVHVMFIMWGLISSDVMQTLSNSKTLSLLSLSSRIQQSQCPIVFYHRVSKCAIVQTKIWQYLYHCGPQTKLVRYCSCDLFCEAMHL